MRNVDIIAPKSSANRLAAIEVWQSVDIQIVGGTSEEPASAGHPIQPYGGVGGDGAVHIVGCWNVGVSGHRIIAARFNGFRVDGSYHVRIHDNRIDNYGTDSFANYRASGVSCGYFAGGDRYSNEVTISNNKFQKASTNRAGEDIFASVYSQVIRSFDNEAVGREVRYIGDLNAFRGATPQFVGASAAYSHGDSVTAPIVMERNSRVLAVGSAGKPIATIAPLSSGLGHDSCMVIVNGNDDNDGNRNFSDVLHVLHGTVPAVLSGLDTGGAPTRTYSLSNYELRLQVASGAYSVRVALTQVKNGNRYV